MIRKFAGNSNNQNPALPEAYRQGFTMFCRCRIDLSEKVLIPRPETEYMARLAIVELARHKGRMRVLDIFSGSGCLGVAIAKNIENVVVDLCDIDPAAIQQIKINLKLNAIPQNRARVLKSDVFENIPAAKYDLIVANPPYVDPARISEVQPSVLNYEPHQALFGGKGGMEIIGLFLRQAKHYLAPQGLIYMEFDPDQAGDVRGLLDDNGYKRYDFLRDQFGFTRFVKASSSDKP